MYRNFDLEKEPTNPYMGLVSSWHVHRDPLIVIDDLANALAPQLGASDPTIPKETLQEAMYLLEVYSIIVKEAFDELQTGSADSSSPVLPLVTAVDSADCG